MAGAGEAPAPAQARAIDRATALRREAALRRIRQWGDPALRASAAPVERFDDHLRGEVARMSALMEEALGSGLAATQLGIMRRLVVLRFPDGPIRALVNPEIAWRSGEHEQFMEGCLSLRDVWVPVERPSRVHVVAADEHGRDVELDATGPEASIVQHELDHLDGVLILDRTTRQERREAVRVLREGGS